MLSLRLNLLGAAVLTACAAAQAQAPAQIVVAQPADIRSTNPGVNRDNTTDGVVLIEVPNQPPVEVRLDHGGNQPMCAIAMIENQGGKLQVTKLVDYLSGEGKISGHEVIGNKYGFKLRWRAGSKG